MAAEQTDPLAPHPERDVVLDTAALRVLAHPMRLSFLHYLRDHGPATGRRLAAQFGLDSGAVSYHLRKLAAGGLIEEDVERGTRRDRWWRVVRQALYHDPATHTASASDPNNGEGDENRAYLHSTLLAYGDALRRYTADVPHLSQDWLNVTMTSERSLRLTPAELTDLKRDLIAVINRYRDLPEQPDTQPVSIHIHALPPPER
jgi:DNA-binding transcriptional ArsR family regulator